MNLLWTSLWQLWILLKTACIYILYRFMAYVRPIKCLAIPAWRACSVRSHARRTKRCSTTRNLFHFVKAFSASYGLWRYSQWVQVTNFLTSHSCFSCLDGMERPSLLLISALIFFISSTSCSSFRRACFSASSCFSNLLMYVFEVAWERRDCLLTTLAALFKFKS